MNSLGTISSKIIDPLLDIVAVNSCYVCNKQIDSQKNNFICPQCLAEFPLPPDPEEVLNILVNAFPKDDLAVSNAYALLRDSVDSPYMELIHSLKYQSFESIGLMYGKLLGEYLLRSKLINILELFLFQFIMLGGANEASISQKQLPVGFVQF
jgi:predicted amidophosphoribosyltransferase